MSNMSEDYAEAVSKWCVERRKEVASNLDGEYLGPYGVTLDQKLAAIEEQSILKPYRMYVFKHVANFLNSLGVSWFLTDGTLLGWYRNKSMIAHDHDIDLSTFEENMLTVWKNRHLLPDDVLTTCSDQGAPEFNWCTDDECYPFDPSKNSAKKMAFNARAIPPMPSNPISYWGATVDLYTYRLEEDGFHNNYMFGDYPVGLKAFPRSSITPLQKSTFEGVDVFVPNNPKEWLETTYGYIGENAVWDEATKLYKPRKQ